MSPVHRALSGHVLHLRFAAETEALEQGGGLAANGHAARTIAKQGALRITLIELAAGGRIPTHRAGAPVSVQVLRGRVRMRAEDRDYELESGDLLTFAPGVEHDVSSDGGGLILLTVAQSHGGTGGHGREAATESATQPAEEPAEGGPAVHDSTGIGYSVRQGEIWAHYPSRTPDGEMSYGAAFPIGRIPPEYRSAPPNAITAERAALWARLLDEWEKTG